MEIERTVESEDSHMKLYNTNKMTSNTNMFGFVQFNTMPASTAIYMAKKSLNMIKYFKIKTCITPTCCLTLQISSKVSGG